MTGKILGSIALVLALALLIQSEKIAQALFSNDDPTEELSEPVAVVVAINGDVLYISPSRKPQNLENNQALRHQDRIRTQESGTATVRLSQGEVVDIEKSSHVLLERSRNQDVTITILSGRILVQQAPPQSKVKVFFQSKSYSLNQFAPETFTINSGRKKKVTDKLPPNTVSNQAQQTESQRAKEDAALAKNVQSVMANQKFWLDKCYANYLKTNPQGSGEIKVLFSLEQDGQVRDTEVHSSSINDNTMENCVLQIVKRARFGPVSEGGNNQFIFPFQFSSQ